MDSSNLPKDDIPEVIEQPLEKLPLISRLILRAGQLPWWLIMLVSVIVGYGVFTLSDPNQRDILKWLLDNPQITTDELNRVVYERKTEAILIDETYLIAPLTGERVEISTDFVINEETGILECPSNAAEDCLSQRGTIVTYQDIQVDADETPTGYFEYEGVTIPTSLLDLSSVGTKVTLPDGNNRLINEDDILEQGESNDYVLACDKLVKPTCEDVVGQYIRYKESYVERQAILARVDVVIRHRDETFQRTIRPTRVLERHETLLTCEEDDNLCVEGMTTIIIYPERITGIETKIDGSKRTVRVVQQQAVTIPRERVLDMRQDLVECDTEANPACTDYVGTVVLAEGETFVGELSTETNRSYKIVLIEGAEATEFDRNNIVEEIRVPTDCRDTDAGGCEITIKLESAEVGGRIIEDNSNELVIETVPEKTIIIDESEIYKVRSRVPAGCALNNPRGCTEGIWLTILVTLTAYTSALIVGLIIGLFRVSSNPILYHGSTFYVEFIRGIPLLVLLMYFAFVIGPLIRDAGEPFSSVYAGMDWIERQLLGKESFLAEATIGLAIGYSAFMAEIFRAGIESIHRGQMEAARSLGMSYVQAMRHVVLPQAIRVVLPPLGNDFIAILKDSALISVLALPDLLQMGRIYAARVFQAKPAYTMVAWVYIVMTLVLSMGVRYVERRSRLP